VVPRGFLKFYGLCCCRHEAVLEDMHQELSVLGADFEAQIEENCQLLKDNLDNNDQGYLFQVE
jgi:hypothetical protein